MEKVDNTQEEIDDVNGDRKWWMPLMCSLVDWTEEWISELENMTI